MTDTELYDALVGLMTAQLDEVIVKAEVASRFVSHSSVAPATRAKELVDWAGISPANREALVRVLAPFQRTLEPAHPPIESAIEKLADAIRPPTDVESENESTASKLDPVECPFVGMKAFDEEDAKYFFGREEKTEEILGKVKDDEVRVVFVLGASGSGKSSVVRAGVVPELKKPDSGKWAILVFKPGEDPHRVLAEKLIRLIDPNADPESIRGRTKRLEPDLERAKGDDLRGYLEDARTGQGSDRVLLVIDQAEELLTPKAKKETNRLLERLVEANDDRVKTLMTLRTEFFDDVVPPEEHAEVIIGQMTRKEFESAILEPARVAGLQYEPELKTRILADLGVFIGESKPNSSANLSLLAFALETLCKKNKGRILRYQTYEDMGHLHGAFAQHANRVYAELSNEEKKRVPLLLSRLVDVHSAEDSRTFTARRVLLKSLDAEDQAVALKLAGKDARLLVTGPELPASEATVELIHETLGSVWDRLRAWIDENKEFNYWKQRIRRESRDWKEKRVSEEWKDRARSFGYLPSVTMIIEARRKWRDKEDAFEPVEEEYIAAGRSTLLFVGSVFLAVLIGLGLAAWWVNREISRDQEVAEMARTINADYTLDAGEAENLFKLQNYPPAYRVDLVVALMTSQTAAPALERSLRWLLPSDLEGLDSFRNALAERFPADCDPTAELPGPILRACVALARNLDLPVSTAFVEAASSDLGGVSPLGLTLELSDVESGELVSKIASGDSHYESAGYDNSFEKALSGFSDREKEAVGRELLETMGSVESVEAFDAASRRFTLLSAELPGELVDVAGETLSTRGIATISLHQLGRRMEQLERLPDARIRYDQIDAITVEILARAQDEQNINQLVELGRVMLQARPSLNMSHGESLALRIIAAIDGGATNAHELVDVAAMIDALGVASWRVTAGLGERLLAEQRSKTDFFSRLAYVSVTRAFGVSLNPAYAERAERRAFDLFDVPMDPVARLAMIEARGFPSDYARPETALRVSRRLREVIEALASTGFWKESVILDTHRLVGGDRTEVLKLLTELARRELDLDRLGNLVASMGVTEREDFVRVPELVQLWYELWERWRRLDANDSDQAKEGGRFARSYRAARGCWRSASVCGASSSGPRRRSPMSACTRSASRLKPRSRAWTCARPASSGTTYWSVGTRHRARANLAMLSGCARSPAGSRQSGLPGSSPA